MVSVGGLSEVGFPKIRKPQGARDVQLTEQSLPTTLPRPFFNPISETLLELLFVSPEAHLRR